MYEVKHISIFIARPPDAVYQFASNPENLARWAAGLASAEISRVGDEWLATAPFGRVKIRFAGKNPLGVMDHDVELETGEVMHNPMRVVPNADGSELIFTLIRQMPMSDQQFAEDQRAIARDLSSLKSLLEGDG